jgi:hypothetical protein
MSSEGDAGKYVVKLMLRPGVSTGGLSRSGHDITILSDH